MNRISSLPYDIACYALLILIFLTVGHARAQMFSVQEDEAVRNRATPNNAILLGWEPADFKYVGSYTGTNAGVYAFDGPLLRAKFETIGLQGYVGLGGRLTGLNDEAYFGAGVRAERGIGVFRRPGFRALIPVLIKSSITTVTSDRFLGSGAQFQQGTLSFGGGAEVNARLGNRVRFSANAVPNYGFSFASGGIFGGQIYEFQTEARLYIDHLFGESGLSVGWDYGFKRFDVEENEFDYNLRTHSFLIGLTF